MKRKTFLRFAAAAALGSTSLSMRAQGRGLIRVLVPFSAGGPHDTMTRLIGNAISRSLGRTVVVENKPGAAGLVGIRALQQASADGTTTLLMTFTGLAALPFTQKGANYDPVRDFAPVAIFGSSPGYLVVHSSIPVHTLPELIAYAKSAPQKLEAATSGPGGWSEVWTAAFARRAGIELLLVPYKGGAAMTTSLIAGEVKLMLSTYSEVLATQVKAGNLRLLASTAEKPEALLPQVPVIQQTLPGFVVDSWYGFVAQPTMPPAEIASISEAVRAAVTDSALRDRLQAMYIDPSFEDPVAFARTMASTKESWRRVTAELGIVPQ